MTEPRKFTVIKRFPKDERIVSMIEFSNRIFVATTSRVYYIENDKLHPLEIIHAGDA